jgi:predicted P-loop ATPase
MAYARIATEKPRQFIILGTTNSHNYLVDPTGNRRFWPVRIQKFDATWIRENRDQLWAEAAERERRGESIRLSPALYGHAALQQERRRTADPWEALLEETFEGEYQRIAPQVIWEALSIPTQYRSVDASKRIAAVMQMLGFRRMTVQDAKGKIVKGWGRGSKLLDPPGEAEVP